MFSSPQRTLSFLYKTDKIQRDGFGKLDIGISALASAFEYRYSLLHSINRPLKLKVLYIFVKRVIFTKVVTYKLEDYDFVRNLIAKNLSENFPRI